MKAKPDYSKLFNLTFKNSKPSSIRELLKLTSDPDFIPLAGGAPANDLIPTDKLQTAMNSAVGKYGAKLFQYGMTEGLPILRGQMVDYLKQHRGIDTSVENILISTGAQTSLDAAFKVFLNHGDSIVCESPTFLATLKLLNYHQVNIHGLRLTDAGIDMDEFERILSREQVKLIYIISSYQNPTGITTGLQQRKRIVELATKYDAIIIEDDPYYELNYTTEHLPTIYSLAPERTIYIGSFSKILGPGLRVGYVVAPTEVVEKLVNARQVNDVHASNLSQAIVSEFLLNENIGRHLDNIRAAYSAKLRLLLEELDDQLPSEVKFTRPTGGMFLWLTLPEWMDIDTVYNTLIENKVALVKGEDFYPSNIVAEKTLRINFTIPTEAQIRGAVAVLAKVFRSQIETQT